MDAAITNQGFKEDTLKDIFDNKEALRFIQSIPIKHENVLTWATNRLEINNELFSLLKKRVEGEIKSHDWMSKWYPNSIEIVHGKYQDIVKENISKFLDEMTEGEILKMRQWTMAELIDSKETEKNRDALVSSVEMHIKSRQ